MLKEEQAAELLSRCELLVGKRLDQIRGNLKNAESRSAALLELLVLEEVSRIGRVEYEPLDGVSPDILLTLPNERKIWIEVAFLYPRFWKQTRLTRAVANWIWPEAENRKIPSCSLSFKFDGERNLSGSIIKLPEL